MRHCVHCFRLSEALGFNKEDAFAPTRLLYQSPVLSQSSPNIVSYNFFLQIQASKEIFLCLFSAARTHAPEAGARFAKNFP